MLAAARAALDEIAARDGVEKLPELLAVTVLTSMDQRRSTPSASPARLPNRWNCWPEWDSTPESAALSARRRSGRPARAHRPTGVLVIPGIRRRCCRWRQKRIATPRCAAQGASYWSWPSITQAPDPAEAAEAILKEMAEALQA